MIVDLHVHYPMHLYAGEPDAVQLMTRRVKDAPLDEKLRQAVLHAANVSDNYGADQKPAVTTDALLKSPVRVGLSVLYAPFCEVDLTVEYGAPARPQYFTELLKMIDMVEAHVSSLTVPLRIAHNQQELQAILADNGTALIHAIEGGFHLGSREEIATSVATLARRGVAYITVAHLFWRQVASNAPALPFLDDDTYRALFPEPDCGLAPYGEDLITAMVANRILVDITHMSRRAIDDTFALLDRLDPDRKVPVLATHSACGCFGVAEYNLSNEHILRIAERNGIIGIIACEHWMTRGMKKPKNIEETMNVICRHIEHILDVTDRLDLPYHFVGFGSDHDGFIKPALAGLDRPAGFADVERILRERYGDVITERICSGNALRVLEAWG